MSHQEFHLSLMQIIANSFSLVRGYAISQEKQCKFGIAKEKMEGIEQRETYIFTRKLKGKEPQQKFKVDIQQDHALTG